MRTRFGMIDLSDAILGFLIALIMMGAAIYAYFTFADVVPTDNADANSALNNTTDTFNLVFNVLRAVLVIGGVVILVIVVKKMRSG